MTNREKYTKEILDIVCEGNNVAVKNGVPCACENIECRECDLSGGYSCNAKLAKWCKAECDNPSGSWQEQMMGAFLGDSRL